MICFLCCSSRLESTHPGTVGIVNLIRPFIWQQTLWPWYMRYVVLAICSHQCIVTSDSEKAACNLAANLRRRCRELIVLQAFTARPVSHLPSGSPDTKAAKAFFFDTMYRLKELENQTQQ